MPVLQFKGKTAVENYHHTVPHHRLEFDAKLSLLGKGEKPSLDGNLIIEGDNLVALKALLPTHAGKVKCIYIDPPYNTGNEGWVYNDNLTQPQFKDWIGRTVGKEGEDACRHDKWCCMMYPRLTLLKELLREDGAIFISIDDNELNNLLNLMTEIFGAENRFGIIIVEVNPRGRRLGTELAIEHEYLVGWTKNILKFKPGRQALTAEQLAEFSEVDEKGRKCRLLGLRKRGALSRREDRPNLHYPIYVSPSTNAVSVEPSKTWIKVLPRLSDGTDGVWRWQKSKVERDSWQLVAREVRRRESGEREWDVFQLDPVENEAGDEKGRIFPSIWQGSEYNNETGRDQLRALFGDPPFDYPKPVGLVTSILRMVGDSDAIILDSFSGSGTTGQATLEMNDLDGGSRQFVLVQQPFDSSDDREKNFNICRDVTAERVRRAAVGTDTFRALGGTFTYARVGEPLFGEYKDFGETLPAYEDIAKYVFYTETSREFPDTTKHENAAWDKSSGRIGECAGRSYYLLYEPNEREDRGLDRSFLKNVAAQDTNRELVVYCERLAVHQDELRKFEREHGKKIRHMLVPFNLK